MPSDGLGGRRTYGVCRDVVAGAFLCAVAGAAYLGISHLPTREGSGIGPGLMPKTVTALMAVLGVAIAALGIGAERVRLERFDWRGPLFVLGAVTIFAATIRPAGLVVAGPLAVIFSALADRDSRPLEIIVYAVLLTGACVLLFKYLLRLPIPLAPFLLGY